MVVAVVKIVASKNLNVRKGVLSGLLHEIPKEITERYE